MPPFSIPIDWDLEAVFIRRKNRFLAHIELEGHEGSVEAHVHDPGRLKEILYHGNRVLVRKAKDPRRRTRFDLIAGSVEGRWVLINSSFHRRISETLLRDHELNPFGPPSYLRPEVKVGDSRLDFLMKDGSGAELYIEVKGCSLTQEGIAKFPDAPTTRGVKHLKELIEIRRKGKRSGILILVLGPKADCFSPNFETDPVFSNTFITAYNEGVEIHPIQFEMKERELVYHGPIPICSEVISQ